MSLDTSPIYSELASDPDLGIIVEMFVEEMPARIEAIEGLLAAKDWEGLRRTAHQLKGSAGSYGFDPVSPIAAELEAAVREDSTEEDIQRHVDQLVSVCRRVSAGPASL